MEKIKGNNCVYTEVPIGLTRCKHRDPEKTPAQPIFAERCEGTVEMFPEFIRGPKDIEGFSHLILVYRLHRAESELLTVTPLLDTKKRGVFSTRCPLRPNRIGISVVRLLGRKGGVLRVQGVDTLDRTPILDIKPYVTKFDSVPHARCGRFETIDAKTWKKEALKECEPRTAPWSGRRASKA
ncbi:MAG TPA: tRNA (N6-threonylcarbamoyladenosine(37)-N6)-methyltransferase TrmO [Chitinivibrionales bacterium]|nr:tRNA (N6-threonylcarbamoyladenosine(37)-N6)-methyltransferase TrmO [Chitinivibrionales bacterium]